MPSYLSYGLQQLYGEDTDTARKQVPTDWEEYRPKPQGYDVQLQDIIAGLQPQFSDIRSRADAEYQEAKVVQGQGVKEVEVDVVFVLDVTGSMCGWIQAAKQ